jgi:hypothetical protein
MIKFSNFIIEDAIQYNIENDIPLTECVFRRESEKFSEYFKYLRENKDKFELNEFDLELLNTDIGRKGLYEGEEVFLDLPFVEKEENPCWPGYVMVGMKDKNGKKVPNCVPEDSLTEEEKIELNKPKRGGSKKFYVYVKNSNGNTVKVSFGDPGMSVNFNDLEARKSFAARHQCDQKKDRTKPGYWSCNLPRYAKSLGLSNGGSFYW